MIIKPQRKELQMAGADYARTLHGNIFNTVSYTDRQLDER